MEGGGWEGSRPHGVRPVRDQGVRAERDQGRWGMLVKFKTMARYGVKRCAYRMAVASGKLRPARTKIADKYPRYWSWDVEKCFGIPAGTIARGEREAYGE